MQVAMLQHEMLRDVNVFLVDDVKNCFFVDYPVVFFLVDTFPYGRASNFKRCTTHNN